MHHNRLRWKRMHFPRASTANVWFGVQSIGVVSLFVFANLVLVSFA